MNDETAASDDNAKSVRPEYEEEQGSQGSVAVGASETRPSAKWPWILLILIVAFAGYGSSRGWFVFSTDEENPEEESQLSAALNAQLDAADAPQADDSTDGLPELSSSIPQEGKAVLAECRRVAEHLVSTTAASPESREMLARFEFQFGEVENAKRQWELVLKQNPAFAYAMRGLGDIATQEGRMEDAVKHYRDAVLVQPTDVTRQMALASAMVAANQTDDALQTLDTILSFAPNHFPALIKRGQLRLLKQDYEQALADFEAAEAISTRDSDLQLGLATALIRLGRREDAKPHQTLHKELRTSVKQEMQTERVDYEDLDAIQSDVADLYTDMSRVYMAAGNNRAAKLLLNRAARMHKDDPNPRQALAWMAANEGRQYDAIRWLTTAQKLVPNEFDIVAEIARLHIEIGEWKFAERKLLEYLTDNSQHIEATELLSHVYFEMEDGRPRAIEYAQKLLDLAPTGANHAWLATIFESENRIEEAIAAMEKAVEASPESEEFAQSLGIMKIRAASNSESK